MLRLKLAGALMTAVASMGMAAAQAQETSITVLSHKVHENVSRGSVPGTTGGDVTGEWPMDKGVKLNCNTANIAPLHATLCREQPGRASWWVRVCHCVYISLIVALFNNITHIN